MSVSRNDPQKIPLKNLRGGVGTGALKKWRQGGQKAHHHSRQGLGTSIIASGGLG